MSQPKIEKIAELNDLCRRAMGVAGKVYQTTGISALSPADQSAIREKVEKFNDFKYSNDPYGEHDFGSFTHKRDKIFWKIDYFDSQDKEPTYLSPDPSDPAVTTRVLTIMKAEEY